MPPPTREQRQAWRASRKAGDAEPLPNNPVEVAELRARIARHYLQGKAVNEISKIVNRSNKSVLGHLDKVRQLWLASALMDFDARRAQELARLDELEATSWTAWHRSQSDKRSISRKTTGDTVPGDDGEPKAVTSMEKRYSREQRTGNHFFLEMVLKCIERRCKILGLDAPEKQDIAMSLSVAQKAQVEFVDRVIANPEAVRAAHTILALTAPTIESVADAGRPGGDAERGPVVASETLDATVNALVRASSGAYPWPDSRDASEARQE